MTKAEIVEQIYERVGFSKKKRPNSSKRFLKSSRRHSAEGEKVKISGFGNLLSDTRTLAKGATRRPGKKFSWMLERS